LSTETADGCGTEAEEEEYRECRALHERRYGYHVKVLTVRGVLGC
jgi:hypothetical protein